MPITCIDDIDIDVPVGYEADSGGWSGDIKDVLLIETIDKKKLPISHKDAFDLSKDMLKDDEAKGFLLYIFDAHAYSQETGTIDGTVYSLLISQFWMDLENLGYRRIETELRRKFYIGPKRYFIIGHASYHKGETESEVIVKRQKMAVLKAQPQHYNSVFMPGEVNELFEIMSRLHETRDEVDVTQRIDDVAKIKEIYDRISRTIKHVEETKKT